MTTDEILTQPDTLSFFFQKVSSTALRVGTHAEKTLIQCRSTVLRRKPSLLPESLLHFPLLARLWPLPLPMLEVRIPRVAFSKKEC